MLEECLQVAWERQETYWTPEINFQRWADILETMFGIKLTLVQLAEILIAMKVSREQEKHKRDNTTDIINYYAIREHLMRIIEK